MSEHMKQPLNAVDLGTKATNLDMASERIFDVATMWKAIVFIAPFWISAVVGISAQIKGHVGEGVRIPGMAKHSRYGTLLSKAENDHSARKDK
jgi:hypothetical protein